MGKEKSRAEWKFVGADEMILHVYPCGLAAGDTIRLLHELVIRDFRHKLTGTVNLPGEVWKVLSGNPAEPHVVWLREPDDREHLWDNETIYDWFEVVSEGDISRQRRIMTVDQIRRLHVARPFQAFDLHLADGRTILVDHPEILAVPPPGRTIGVGMPDGTIEIIDLLLVVSLKPRGNGSATKKRRGA